MQKTKINWGMPNLYTWNPVTGCKRGCSYCYARKIHERFYKSPFSDIVFHLERLNEPGLRAKKPRTIFVGSMSDIWYWDKVVLASVLVDCVLNPQHTFMFLSKDYTAYDGIEWPKNTMQGVTMECDREVFPQRQIVETFLRSKGRRHFFSLEPLLGTLKVDILTAEKVIVGAMTGHGAVPVKPEWIQSIKDHVPEDKIFWKDSIKDLI
jgi:protein gp37